VRYGSVCSGIEAATVAWHPLGWTPAFFSEIEKFPRAVLQHHYPTVPLDGDFTTIKGDEYGPIDLLVGGTPCQSFSSAGLRKGLADARGNLALEYLRLVDRTQPRWIVWENVPGVLSSNQGRDFGSLLGALAELGYGYAWRVLDAQYFGVAQRRRRVFLVGHLGDWRPAAAVLFRRESLCGNPPPSGNEKVATSPCLRARANCSHRADTEAFVPVKSNGNMVGVRRLTPRERERLQGFPDDYTALPGAADGPRFKALGNSMAVPVMRWIGERICAAERTAMLLESSRTSFRDAAN